jgi:hypothetical protein
MTRRFDFEIPCPHEADPSISHGVTLPDYHPLTTEEIAKLLNFAKEHKGDGCTVAAVQVRLGQAVKGCTCPRTIHGESARRSTQLDRIFVDRYELGGTPDLVEVIERLLDG